MRKFKTSKIKQGEYRSRFRFKPFYRKLTQRMEFQLMSWSMVSYMIDVEDKDYKTNRLSPEARVFGINFGLPSVVWVNRRLKIQHKNSLEVRVRKNSKGEDIVFYHVTFGGLKAKPFYMAQMNDGKPFCINVGRPRYISLVNRLFKDKGEVNIPKWGYHLRFKFIWHEPSPWSLELKTFGTRIRDSNSLI